MDIWTSRWVGVPYRPRPEERPYLERVEVQKGGDLVVKAAVLSNKEGDRFFGVNLARRGIQPVWLEITNSGREPYRIRLASLDPGYYPPLEAAYANHYHIVRRILGFGVMAWFFLPLLAGLPFKLLAARIVNRRMDQFFQDHALGWALIRPGTSAAGFVYTSLDEGSKQFTVRLFNPTAPRDFAFSIPVPGLRVDHGTKELDALAQKLGAVECDEAELKKRLEAMPRCTTNRTRTRDGDPLNLVVIGEFETVLSGFGARWDETEAITFKSCLQTFLAFALGRDYRYSPVSALYVNGRSQDFALQRVRESINERLHLRLWLTPLRYRGKPVWIGQISRDIGVRFTPKTWNLTTHKIDPDVDDARDYLLDVLLESGRVALAGYVPGAQAADRSAPRHNLTGDPYFSDGLRAVVMFSETRTEPTYVNWA